jgi:thioredoxin 1
MEQAFRITFTATANCYCNCINDLTNFRRFEMRYVREAEFDEEVLRQSGKVLVDFTADWCAPCQAQAPILELIQAQIEESTSDRESLENENEVKIVKVNVDESVNLAALYQVSSIPTLILFEGGKLVHRSVGFQSEQTLRRLLGVVPNMLKH